MEAKPNSWMRPVLCAAALYDLLWGLWVVVFPEAAFRLVGAEPPAWPEAWQNFGIAVAIGGVGYGIAATNPVRHWPLVLIGFLGKVFGPLVFWRAASTGHLPWSFSWMVVVNDAVWIVPFALILRAAYENHLGQIRQAPPEVLSFALRTRVHEGVSLHQLSGVSPVLMVFLRHAGCTFCREALADLGKQRVDLEEAGVQIVLVHMGEPQFGREFFAKYGLDGVAQISDPHRTLYRAFGLRRGDLRMLLGPKVWWRGLHAGLLDGHGAGYPSTDPFQMPGIFLLFHGQILRCYRHQSAADRPNYVRFATNDLHEPVT
ncbi:MAG: SelL-related redox protein [Bryobacteraceae bacterium]|nr:SelL-related redox protein [Bryobacteraceae bacterium]